MSSVTAERSTLLSLNDLNIHDLPTYYVFKNGNIKKLHRAKTAEILPSFNTWLACLNSGDFLSEAEYGDALARWLESWVVDVDQHEFMELESKNIDMNKVVLPYDLTARESVGWNRDAFDLRKRCFDIGAWDRLPHVVEHRELCKQSEELKKQKVKKRKASSQTSTNMSQSAQAQEKNSNESCLVPPKPIQAHNLVRPPSSPLS